MANMTSYLPQNEGFLQYWLLLVRLPLPPFDLTTKY